MNKNKIEFAPWLYNFKAITIIKKTVVENILYVISAHLLNLKLINKNKYNTWFDYLMIQIAS